MSKLKQYRNVWVVCEYWPGINYVVGKRYYVNKEGFMINEKGDESMEFKPNYGGGRFRILDFNHYLNEAEKVVMC